MRPRTVRRLSAVRSHGTTGGLELHCLRADVLLRAPQSLQRPVPRRPPAIKPGTERGQYLHHVPHQVVGDLGIIQHHQARPCADRAASTSSVFIRPSLSRCSTTTTVTAGSASSLRTFAREPFMPDPTSASARTTGRPAFAAHADSRATCPSRPGFSVVRGHPRVQASAISLAGRLGSGLRGPQDHTVRTLRRDRRSSPSVPAVGGLHMDALRMRPLGQIHNSSLLYSTYCMLAKTHSS